MKGASCVEYITASHRVPYSHWDVNTKIRNSKNVLIINNRILISYFKNSIWILTNHHYNWNSVLKKVHVQNIYVINLDFWVSTDPEANRTDSILFDLQTNRNIQFKYHTEPNLIKSTEDLN